MSLVNDLLIEIDRTRADSHRTQDSPLDGLSPRRAEATRKARTGWIATGTIAGVVGLSSFLLLDPLDSGSRDAPPAWNEGGGVEVSRTVGSREPLLPEVSSRGDAASAIDVREDAVITAPASGHRDGLDLRIERPVQLQDLRVEQNGRTTRVRLRVDRRSAYRIDPDPGHDGFQIVLQGAVLARPLASIDLVGTSVRSLQTHHDANALNLHVALDADMRIQSYWVDRGNEAALIIDLQPSERASAAFEIPVANDDPHSLSVADPVDAILPSLAISRSDGDRTRNHREANRSLARHAVESARIARSEGRLEEASDRYAEALEQAPGFREAILEWTTLLHQMSRDPQALDLIRSARRADPDDSGYTMLHARILAEADLDGAIRLLEGSGHNLTEAPEVYALTAAYLQRAGQHDSAIERYETLLRRFPSRPNWWMGMGISLEAVGRNPEAVDVYRIAIQLGQLPGRSRAWVTSRIAALSEKG